MHIINAPPRDALNVTIGIDSIFLQFREIYRRDLDQFCKELGLKYKEKEQGAYTREWIIFLAGGQPITVVYHLSSKTTTFQIGKLMNYSRKMDDQHTFVQNIMCHYADKEMQVSGLDFAVDTKVDIASLILKSNRSLKSKKNVGSTIYYNYKNGTVFTMYNKSMQMQLYSTTLTRSELRIRRQLSHWKVQNFTENKESIKNLSVKIEQYFEEAVELYTIDGKQRLFLGLDKESISEAFESFIGFLHGDSLPLLKDHFKIHRALLSKDVFLAWMADNDIVYAKDISAFVKGRKSTILKELGIDHKTFNKAAQFYKGIPNFKISA